MSTLIHSNRWRLSPIVFAASLSFTPIAMAADAPAVDWLASAALGLKAFEFEEQRQGVILSSQNTGSVGATFSNDADYDETLPYLDLGLGLAFSQFYLVGNIELPLQDVDFKQSFVGRNATGAVNRNTNVGDLSRLDYSITFGYNVMEGVALFAGFKAGETELDFDTQSAPNIPPDYESSYEEDGFFVGGSYTIDVAEAGALTFSIAYADFDAEYSESGSFGVPNSPTNVTTPLLDGVRYDGDADGFSYGVQWTGGLAESLQYRVALKYQKYELDGGGSRQSFTNTNVTGEPPEVFNNIGLDIETTQEITTFSVGLAYIF
ncbi:MAG: hypothetical protein AAGG11_01025 [Pseudomonadota bacterium]